MSYRPQPEYHGEADLDLALDEQSVIMDFRNQILADLQFTAERLHNISTEAFKDAYINIEQTIDELFGDEYRRLGKVTGELSMPISGIQAEWRKSWEIKAASLKKLPNPAMSGFRPSARMVGEQS